MVLLVKITKHEVKKLLAKYATDPGAPSDKSLQSKDICWRVREAAPRARLRNPANDGQNLTQEQRFYIGSHTGV